MAEYDMQYLEARKIGLKEYSRNASKGHAGYLPYLEGLIKNIEIVTEIDIGIIDIPLKKIVGTYSYARSRSFAANFMPILGVGTEFGQKWSNLCKAHLTEGLRDPIKVYEYLNWFYVVEGNKRVSVLKFFEAHSFRGRVTRLIPKYDESDPDIVLYYEFLNFYKKTGLNSIWFTKKKSFAQLFDYIENFQYEETELFPDKNKYFASSVYTPFRKAYLELGGQKLPITTGDAFLEYVKVYGMPREEEEELLKPRLGIFMKELENLSGSENLDVQVSPKEGGEGLISTLTTLVRPKKILKVAFAYARDIRKSSWTYSHEMGRCHVERVLKDEVNTSFEYNIPEGLDAFESLKMLAENGNDVIFATSPAFINASLKTAIEYPDVKILNCSETHSFKLVNTYFGRIYEPRFLAGLVAGSSTRSGAVGYIGTFPIAGVINGMNSFALGVKMVNPHAKVLAAWTSQWDDQDASIEAGKRLISQGADIVSHHDTLSNREFNREFGVYSLSCGVDNTGCVPENYIAAPVWNWGIFYEKILRSILNNTWRSSGAGQKMINFWWGMDSGLVDFFYSSRRVPREAGKLVDFMKKSIMNGTYNPFNGPIYDREGNLRVKPGECASHDEIVTMSWLVDFIEGEIPEIIVNDGDRDLMHGILD